MGWGVNPLSPLLFWVVLCGLFAASWVITDGYRRKQATKKHPLRIVERIAGRKN